MKIIIQPSAKKNLKKLPKEIIIRILKKLKIAQKNPLASFERLKNSYLWKLRIGDCELALH